MLIVFLLLLVLQVRCIQVLIIVSNAVSYEIMML